MPSGPHAGQPVAAACRSVDAAEAVVLLVHGRGGSAQEMLRLAAPLGRQELAYLAPQAAQQSWYPYGFMAPIERNEPGLSSALSVLGELVAGVAAAGIPDDRIVLVGFSQGTCLVLEFAARHTRRWGGVVGLSGGLIGPARRGTIRVRSTGPRCSWDVATWIRTFLSSGWRRAPWSSTGSAPPSPNGSIGAWRTRCTRASSTGSPGSWTG